MEKEKFLGDEMVDQKTGAAAAGVVKKFLDSWGTKPVGADYDTWTGNTSPTRGAVALIEKEVLGHTIMWFPGLHHILQVGSWCSYPGAMEDRQTLGRHLHPVQERMASNLKAAGKDHCQCRRKGESPCARRRHSPFKRSSPHSPQEADPICVSASEARGDNGGIGDGRGTSNIGGSSEGGTSRGRGYRRKARGKWKSPSLR